MQASAIGAFAPAVLLCAAMGSWSLISLLFLLAFFAVQYSSQRRGPQATPRPVLWMSVVLLATTVIVAEGVVELAWAVLGSNWKLPESPFWNLLGLARLNPWEGSLGVLLSLLPQFAVALTAACSLYQEQQGNRTTEQRGRDDGRWNCRVNLRNFLLPAVQIVVGVARPSWIALPYFLCSCVGLLHWSLTSNFVGLSWGWRPLLWFTGIHIFLLYTYQLPISFPDSLYEVANYFGLFKASQEELGWPEILQAGSLIALYILLCFAINDLRGEQSSQESADDESVVEGSMPIYDGRRPSRSSQIRGDSLTQPLLPSQLPTSQREANLLSRPWASDQMATFTIHQNTINFITYGFPVCIIALISWSFIYASLSAFGLLVYVGYIIYAFPSILILRKLNPILLGFILSWALSTYVFNAAFSVISEQSQMGMEIWHSIGLWHYVAPGIFIFAQFALGVLVAADIFVSNWIIKNMNEAENPCNEDQDPDSEDNEDWKVLILAVIAWCSQRSAYVISLVLIFIVGMEDFGLLHVVYVGFFLMYLVSSSLAKRTGQHLILFCELHFAALYLLKLDWISGVLKAHEAQMKPVLLQLGLWNQGRFQEFFSIGLLLCFLAGESHGLKVLNSLSASLHQNPYPPVGWGILRVGSGRSVLLSVYASQNFGCLQEETSSNVNWVTKHLAAIAESVRATYRSFGTYIAYGTVLTVINAVEPNYIALGYLSLLLFWVIGRQIMGRTDAWLWYPLMVFSGVVFIFRYSLTAVPGLEEVMNRWFSLQDDFGFNADSSLIGHLWDSLAILAVMQVYRFERGQVASLTEEPDEVGDDINSNNGLLGFTKRFIILHCGKVLTITVFYACISPVGVTGFLYLVMLIGTCNMSKSSRFPGQLYAVYTGLLAVGEYLFQMLGNEAEMFPGQTHEEFAHWIGFHVYGQGFWGTEAGLRSKVLVLAACILQYCSFHWLDQLPASLCTDEQYGEPCFLFLSCRRQSRSSYQAPSEGDSIKETSRVNVRQHGLKTGVSDVQITGRPGIVHQAPSILVEGIGSENIAKGKTVGLDTESASSRKSDRKVSLSSSFRDRVEIADWQSSRSPWGSAKESRRWTKRAVLLVKQERYEAQLRTLSIYMKHIFEHLFRLYGLEISMLSLLVASFTVLNVISLGYIFVLGLCILLSRETLRIIWPFLVIVFACILVTEYAVLGNRPPSWNIPPSLNEPEIQCNNCAYSSKGHTEYCWRCWLGLAVDDRQMLVAHFMIFFVTSLQLRANLSAGIVNSRSLYAAVIPAADRLAWKEMSYETSGQWTWLDHVRFLFYRHLLHVVLLLVFATGTLQYDVLHLGYLTFSLVFFRMRSTIMTKRNSIFRFLRLYNFILIAASLIYQAPYFGYLINERCAVITDVYNIVGLYKMRFGFRITARSALVDITIFCVAGLQTHIFKSREFEQVLRYLESEQVEARAHAQEDKAAWKKEHLQRLREMEELKLQRRLQVEKMKTDMLHLQLQLGVLNSRGKYNDVFSPPVELDDCVTTDNLNKFPSNTNLYDVSSFKDAAAVVPPVESSGGSDGDYHVIRRRKLPPVQERSLDQYNTLSEDVSRADKSLLESSVLQRPFTNSEGQFPTVVAGAGTSSSQISCSEHSKTSDDQWQKQGLLSSVQLLGDGVAQVQNLGNKALVNLLGLFNLDQDSDETESSSTDHEVRADQAGNLFEESCPGLTSDVQQQVETQAEMLQTNDTWRRISMLCHYLWLRMASNTDIVCYFVFVLAYTWNFSFLTLFYPATLFLYALLVNPGPSQQFWFVMLVYTELNILLQYMYQIHVQNCDGQEVSLWLQKLGLPQAPMKHSFVISVLPLFLVYLTTLLQSSIKARDGEWMFVDDTNVFSSSRRLLDAEGHVSGTYVTLKERLWKVGRWARDSICSVGRALSWYWQALGSGSEAPPHFVQVSLHVGKWPEDGIQPERIESGVNRLLAAVHQSGFSEVKGTLEGIYNKEFCSRVRVESIENSPGKPSMALAVLEVIYAAPQMGSLAGEHYQTLTPAADVAAELQRAIDDGLVEQTAFPYPLISVIPGGKREVDLYALIFGTDLIAFLYVGLFYQSTVKHSDQLIGVYQVEDQFPKEFVFVLMTLFFLIMVDRVLYLCSFTTGKVLYYFCCLGIYTGYVSDFVWGIQAASGTDHQGYFWQLLPLRGFYLMKALSLSLQAVQLKYGLPHIRTLFGQFLTRRINPSSWLGFRIYRSLPFLYELRCVLDWSCTTTALSMYDWLKLEDIYASLFLVQCDIKLIREKHRLGQKQPVTTKFCSGVLLFSTLIGVIWAPMLIYSSGNPTNNGNEVIDVRARIEVKTGGGKFTLFETGLCQVPFLKDVLQAGSSTGDLDDPYTYLSSYDLRDVQLICCGEDSESLWMIPPPTLRNLLDSVDDDLIIQSLWEFNRNRPKGKEMALSQSEAMVMNSTLIALELRGVLNGTQRSLNIPKMYPRYFRIPGSGEVRQLEETGNPNVESYFVSGNLTLNREGSSWWSFERSGAYDGDGCGSAKGPMAFTVSEEVPTGIIGDTLSKFSIWSLYLTFVLAVGRFIRLQCSDIRMRIPFENFPSCDRLLAICEDIYAARSQRELELEEGLFWTLIKIYRTPHILMEYTKVE